MARKKGETSTYTYIKDDVLHPYYIREDNFGLTVLCETRSKVAYHFSKMEHALQRIIRLQLNDMTEEQTLTLEEYVETLKEITKKVTDAIQS